MQNCNSDSSDSKTTSNKDNKAPTTKIDSAAIKGKINDYNTQFMIDAAHASWAKLFLGKLASNRGRATVTKNLGQDMIEAHLKENKVLIALAYAEKINIPRVMGSEQQRFLDTLSLQKGNHFDRMYVDYLVEMYRNEITYFEDGLQKLTRPGIIAFAKEMLPMLRQHLTACEKVHKQL